jgi:hypothetical protein
MKPSNKNTAEWSRFSFPGFGEAECHESVDLSVLPGTQQLDGNTHYLVMSSAEGKIYATSIEGDKVRIPEGGTIQAIRGTTTTYENARHLPNYLVLENTSFFEGFSNYDPQSEPGTLAIVQADVNNNEYIRPDQRFDDAGVAIVPADQPLPNITNNLAHSRVLYNLLGFIGPNDRLITWSGPTSYNVRLVDWCIVDNQKRNRFEAALLDSDTPNGTDLGSLLTSHLAPAAYLRYYDARYKTRFMPNEGSSP